jgi:hypothetical protein
MGSKRERVEAAALLLVWITICTGWALVRPGWMDEFITSAWTDPRASYGDLWQFWQADPHPPAYYALLREWRGLVPADPHNLFAMRAFGLIVSLLSAAAALWYWSASGRKGLWIYALLLLSAPATLYFPNEARSYFMSLGGGALLSIYFLNAAERRTPRIYDILAGAVGAVLCATHMVSLLFAGFALTVLFLLTLRSHSRAWMWRTIGILVCVLGPVCLFVAATILPGLLSAIGSFWITRHETLRTPILFPLWVGIPLACAIALGLWRARSVPQDGQIRASLLWLATIVAFLATALVVAMIKPFLMPRYLTAVCSALAAPATILIYAALPRLAASFDASSTRRYALASGAFVIGVAMANFTATSGRGDFKTANDAIASLPVCRDAEIPFVIDAIVPEAPGPWAPMFEWYGPNQQYSPASAETLARVRDQACPVRLWLAQYEPRYLSTEATEAVHTACEGNRIALSLAHGFLIVDGDAQDLIDAWRGGKRACSAVPTSSGPVF